MENHSDRSFSMRLSRPVPILPVFFRGQLSIRKTTCPVPCHAYCGEQSGREIPQTCGTRLIPKQKAPLII
jgi:hypothetical protein